MEHQNRRQFIRKGLSGLSGAAILPLTVNRKATEAAKTEKDRKVIYRTLGRTGIRLPIVSMGAGDTDNPNLIRAAMDEGIVLYATSEYYMNGKNEEMIGKIVRERGKDSVVIMTAANPPGIDHQQGLFTDENNTEQFIKQAEGCMKRLGMDPLDIFFLPFAARKESVYFKPLLSAMEKIKKEGMARYIGIATHSWEQEAIRAAADVGIYDVVMTQYNFRRRSVAEIDEAIAYAGEQGLGIIAMKTMAGGYWDNDKKEPINKKAALKWVLKNENIHTAVPGFTTFDQMQEDLSVMEDLELTQEEKSDLRLARTGLPTGMYCQQCGTCRAQCIKAYDIPTAMRSYMYAYAYRNLLRARQTLAASRLPGDPCKECAGCQVTCSMGFDVRKKLEDIARLGSVPEDFVNV
jgi:predicted aldo/keto reductase-like oxidoreductase